MEMKDKIQSTKNIQKWCKCRKSEQIMNANINWIFRS